MGKAGAEWADGTPMAASLSRPLPAPCEASSQEGGARGFLYPAGLRVTGPGRLERAYRRRIARLEESLGEREEDCRRAAHELELAGLIERGTARHADRLESELERVRSQASRLLVTLGAMQRENEQLRSKLERAQARLAAPSREGARPSTPSRRWRLPFPRSRKR